MSDTAIQGAEKPVREAPADRLVSTTRANAHQREWFQEFRRSVMEDGNPYVIADAVSPHEIFHTMDIPVLSIPWYSAVIAAKQLSPYYFELMDKLGYHDGLPRYGSLPYMTTLDNNPERAPYGGLPKPMLIMDRLRGDYVQRVAEQWSGAFGCPTYVLDNSCPPALDRDWHKKNQHGWEALYGSERLDFQQAQLEALVRTSEVLSHRTFDRIEFTRQMHLVNRAGELAAQARDLIARTIPSPVPLTEQLNNIMAATWSRGSQWAVDHLQFYNDELQGLVDKGAAACKDERVRLLWLNNGLWFNTKFYRAFEQSHGAVFVWTMYTNFFSDGYRKYFGEGDDPMRALAARHISMNEQLHQPPWMADWIIQQAKDFGAHGAVMLIPVGDRMSAYGTRFAKLALEKAGIPVLELTASMVDARLWDDAANTRLVGDFIERRIWKK